MLGATPANVAGRALGYVAAAVVAACALAGCSSEHLPVQVQPGDLIQTFQGRLVTGHAKRLKPPARVMTDRYTVVTFNALEVTREVRIPRRQVLEAAPGHEFVVAYTDDPPHPAGAVAEGVYVDGTPRRVTDFTNYGPSTLVVSVPVGRQATFTLVDGEKRYATVDLRTGAVSTQPPQPPKHVQPPDAVVLANEGSAPTTAKGLTAPAGHLVGEHGSYTVTAIDRTTSYDDSKIALVPSRGHEFLVAYLSADDGLEDLPPTTTRTAASSYLIVDGTRRAIPHGIRGSALVVSVPAGHAALLVVDDADKSLRFDLRTGATASTFRSRPPGKGSSATDVALYIDPGVYKGSGTARMPVGRGYGELTTDVSMSFRDAVLEAGTDDRGRADLRMRVTSSLNAPGSFSPDKGTLQLLLPDGAVVAPRLIYVGHSGGFGDESYLAVFKVPGSLRQTPRATLRIAPGGTPTLYSPRGTGDPLDLEARDLSWWARPPAATATLSRG